MGNFYRILMVWCGLLTVEFLCKIIIGAIATGDVRLIVLTTIFVIVAGSCTIHCLIEALNKKEPK